MWERRKGRAGQQVRQLPDPRWVGRGLRFKKLYRSGAEFELMGRAMGFAGLAMLTVFPLLIVVAAAGAASRRGMARWVVYGMGLSGSSARAVVALFAAPGRVLGTTSVFSFVLLAVFGLAFAGSVQGGYEKIWGLSAGPWHKIWRQVVWLIVLITYIYGAATIAPLTHRAAVATVSRVSVSVSVVLGIAFFWWGLHFLAGGRVTYRSSLPGAVATVALLAGLRAFSALVFEPLIVANAVTYGTVGTLLIVQSWLVGVGWVVYGGQLFGRWFNDVRLRPRTSADNQGDARTAGLARQRAGP